MLTDKEHREVDEYIETYLAPAEDEYEEIDDFIVACSCDSDLLIEFESLVSLYMRRLMNIMEKEFTEHLGVTPSMIAAQERLYQFKMLKNKLNDIDSTKDLAMLCLASSFDLYWLSLQVIRAEKSGSNNFE